jgi:hypothetical protein
LQCERQNCSEILILHMGYFDYSHYALTIRFYGLESIHNRYVIRDVIFFVSAISENETIIIGCSRDGSAISTGNRNWTKSERILRVPQLTKNLFYLVMISSVSKLQPGIHAS